MSWFIREVTQPLGRARPLCTGRPQQAPHLRYSLSLPSEQQGPSVSPIPQGWPGWVGTVFSEQGSSDLSLMEQGRQATGQSGSRSLSAQSWTWLSFQLSNIWETRPPTGEMSEAKCLAEPKAGNPGQQRQKPQAPQRHWVWGPLGFSPAGRLLTNPPAHPGHNSKEGLSCRPCPHPFTDPAPACLPGSLLTEILAPRGDHMLLEPRCFYFWAGWGQAPALLLASLVA